MKKFLKYTGWTLAIFALFALFCLSALYLQHKDWIKFQDALSQNNIKAMQTMLDDGYEINREFFGVSHLTGSFENKDIKLATIDYLIQNGANVNKTEDNASAPIINAIYLKRPDIVKLLIKNGAATNIELSGLNLAELSIIFNQPQIVDLLPPMPIRKPEIIYMGKLKIKN